jgi:hypothetical protein
VSDDRAVEVDVVGQRLGVVGHRRRCRGRAPLCDIRSVHIRGGGGRLAHPSPMLAHQIPGRSYS